MIQLRIALIIIIKNSSLLNLKQILRYLIDNALIQVLNIVFSMLTLHYFKLTDLGVYTLSKSIIGGLQHAHLGSRSGLDRLLPEKSENVIANTKRVSITYLINNCIALIIIVVFFLFEEFNYVYFLFSLGGLILSNISIYRVVLRGSGNTKKFINVTFIVNLMTVLPLLLALPFYGLHGVSIAYFISVVLLFVYLFTKLKFRTIFLSFSQSISFLKIGLPVFLSGLIFFLFNNLDKFLIEHFLGLEKVGEFGVIILIYSLLLIVPALVNELTFTEYIKNKYSPSLIRKILTKHLTINSVYVIIGVISSYLILPYIIEIFLEKYYYLVDLMNLISLAIIPQIVISPLHCLLFANDKSKYITISQSISLVCYLIASILLLRNDGSFHVLIWFKIISSFLYGLFMLFWVIKYKLIPFKNSVSV